MIRNEFVTLVTLFLASSCVSTNLRAQVANPTVAREGLQVGPQPVYRVTVIARTTKAVNYRHRSGWTKVDLQGTPLAPEATGHADVNSRKGYLEVKAEMHHLKPASRFGPEYLTYVMWAITPEGRANNLGEVLPNDGDNSKLDVTTELQAFGLIVTAEPYFAVTQPSDVVVMENIIRTDTVGKIEEIDAKYELLQRGQYTLNVSPASLRPIWLDPKTPLELVESRNAVRIARWNGADRYAADTMAKAEQQLRQAEEYQARNAGRKPVIMTAREAVQTAEDARIIASKRQIEEQAAAERQASADRQARTEQERAAAEQARQIAEEARAQAVEARAQADQARAQAEVERARAEKERERAEAAQAAAVAQQDQLAAEAARARESAAEAERLRQNAENDRAQIRKQLLDQLNLILVTRDTARGLIVNMSDVLFDTGQHILRPGAREKLAKIAGIVLAHPGLTLEVEGHTDAIGGDEYNQRLSERRAMAVRDYLVQQGLNMNSVAARGFGKAVPIASNATAAGRQQNRRVELVVSGEMIGNRFGSTQSGQAGPPLARP